MKMIKKTLKLILLCCVCFLFVGVAVQAQESMGQNINLDVKNMSVIDVLRLLAEQGQVNIVASKNVQGRITAKLQDITVEQALEAILDANNFVYKKDRGVIKVFAMQDILQQEQTEKLFSRVFLLSNIKAADFRQVLNSIKSARGRVEINTVSNQVIVTDTLEKIDEIEKIIFDSDRNMITKIYSLNYADANELKEKLVELIPKQSGEVFVDERTNGIVVRAVAETIEKVDMLMKSWDMRSAQVLIEAKILEVSFDNTKGVGVTWEYQSDTVKDSVGVSASLPVSVSGGGIFKVGTLSADEYAVTIQALESSTNTNILSNPRIVVLDNTEANILVGSAEPYLVTYIDKESNTQTEETKFIDVGVKLNVTPKISKDDFITLKIHPEVSSARRVAEVNNALAVDTTQADTTVVIKDGETIVMGGLIKDTTSKIRTKVPILGDIPLIGLLFRSYVDTKVKKEIVVFITPHILKVPSILTKEQKRSEAVEQAMERAGKKWQEWEAEGGK
ncbi:MAG: secretin N-terminal domain-containing protein [Candidatus Omnitrophota bacterium]